MCCLFGLIDTTHQMPVSEKNRIVSILATASEARGTDATGYACNSKNKLLIEKHPIPAHRMKFRLPRDAHIIMGHTRMTTQGNARRIFNNHPFPGKVGHMQFALAHNGVLTNDESLRITHHLPRTRIETDSYVAVQLIEQRNSLDLESIRIMAEAVKGTFNFTLLDKANRLYIVKGNNPLCLYHFRKEGFYLYASTELILDEAVTKLGFEKLSREQIVIHDGEILVIDSDGSITRSNFTPPVSNHFSFLYSSYEPEDEGADEYRRYLMDFAATQGVPRKELEWLHACGFPDTELEECVFSSTYRNFCLMDSGYYDETEDEDHEFDDFESLLWG